MSQLALLWCIIQKVLMQAINTTSLNVHLQTGDVQCQALEGNLNACTPQQRRKCGTPAKELTLSVCKVSQNSESCIKAGTKYKSNCSGRRQNKVQGCFSGFVVVVSDCCL